MNEPIKIVAENRKARFNYHIIENFEAGLVLTGAEIKSVRSGGISLQEGYIRPTKGELWMYGVHIKQYSHSTVKDYDPLQPRKLLMHASEIKKLAASIEQKGLTIVPLKVYLKRGRAKIEIGLAKGKAGPDKRNTIKGRDAEREMQRAIKGAR